MNHLKEIKVAVFVIISGVMLYTGFNFLKGIDFFSSTNRFYAEYDNVQGLNVSNPVFVNGLSIGRISEIKILNDSARTVKVGFDISKDVKLGQEAKVLISNLDLLGSKGLVLYPGDASNPLAEKSTLKGEVQVGFADKLAQKADPLLKNANGTIVRLNTMLNDQNLLAFSQIVANLNSVSSGFDKMMIVNSKSIQQTTQNIALLSRSLIETESQLKLLMSKLNTTADSVNKMQLANTVAKLNQSVENLNLVMDNVNSGKGTVGQLMTNDSLYRNVNSTIKDLDLLLVNFKEKPARYVHFSVFGKKSK